MVVFKLWLKTLFFGKAKGWGKKKQNVQPLRLLNTCNQNTSKELTNSVICHTVISSILSSTEPTTPVWYNCSHTMCKQNFSTLTQWRQPWCLIIVFWSAASCGHATGSTAGSVCWKYYSDGQTCKTQVRMITAIVYRNNVTSSSTTNKHFYNVRF